MKHRSQVLCAALLVASTVFPRIALPQASAPTPQKVRVLTLLGRPLQFVAADKLGLFAKYGLAVENDNKKNSDELRADLAAGNGDLAYLAVDNAVAMVELTSP